MTTAPSSPPDPPAPLVVRLAELAVMLPLELSSRLVDAVPAVAEKVPGAADRVRREVVLARFIGKLAVDQGLNELRSRIASSGPVEPAESVGRANTVDGLADAAQREVADTSIDEGPAPDASALALADYDHLSSSQVVAKLTDLDPAELDEIAAYERANRHRRTVLGKLEQLGAT